jgi:hypothetical protein
MVASRLTCISVTTKLADMPEKRFIDARTNRRSGLPVWLQSRRR